MVLLALLVVVAVMYLFLVAAAIVDTVGLVIVFGAFVYFMLYAFGFLDYYVKDDKNDDD